jgi:SAM-dependent methyltransferase
MRQFKYLLKAALALAVVSMASLAVLAADDKVETDVIYLPTPQTVVEKMLEVAKVTKKDMVYDLGCGDARIPLTAARKYGCKAKGFDIDPARIKDSMANWKKEKKEVQDLVKITKQNIFDDAFDISEANVVTLYLLPQLNVRLVPKLKKLKPGSRIVSHAFDMRGYKPDSQKSYKLKDDDGEEREFEIYLWTIPLKPQKDD